MKILIAEDETTCRLALEITLKKWGYDVVVAKDGKEAWQILQQPDSPKIAILDWLMPGIDGIEVCRKINETKTTGCVYIIILTVKKREEDVIACLQAGADDYIVKPFDKEVLRDSVATGARRVIATHTIMSGANQAERKSVLEHYILQMEKLAEERYLQQLHIDRMATIGLLSAGIAHEINNPTTYVLGSAKNLKLFWEQIEPILQKSTQEAREDGKNVDFIFSRIQTNIDAICSGIERILNVTDGLKSFSHLGQGPRTACDVNMCVLHSLEFCRNSLKNNIKVEKNLARSLPKVMADNLQIEQVLINLFINAADAMEEQAKGTLSIRTRAKNDLIVITVSDTGPGIPEGDMDNIWQPFFTTKPVGKGTGLGLATIRKIVDSHSGKVKAKNKPSGGVEFTVVLPAIQYLADPAEQVP